MQLALSTRWNAARCVGGHELAPNAKHAGFNAIALADFQSPALLPELEKDVAASAIQVTSVGAEIATAREALLLAERLRCPNVVLSLGRVAMSDATAKLAALAGEGRIYQRDYIPVKLAAVTERAQSAKAAFDLSAELLREIIPLAEVKNIRVAVTMGSTFEALPLLAELTELLAHFPALGVWHDFGAVQKMANLGFLNHAEVIQTVAPRITGAYVHDVAWPVEGHLVPFSAKGVPFDALMPLMPTGIPFVWDMQPSQRRIKISEARVDWLNRYSAR